MDRIASGNEFVHQSLLTGGGLFLGDPRVFELIILTFLFCTFLWVLLEAVYHIGRLIIRHQIGVGKIEQCLQARLAAEKALQSRIARLAQQVEDLAAQNSEQRTLYEQQRRRLRDIVQIETQYLRVLGEELTGCHCYYAYVYNRYVEQWNQIGKSHAMLHKSWSKPQPIQIWSASIAEARALLADRFPNSYGFVVVRLVPAEKRFAQVDVV